MEFPPRVVAPGPRFDLATLMLTSSVSEKRRPLQAKPSDERCCCRPVAVNYRCRFKGRSIGVIEQMTSKHGFGIDATLAHSVGKFRNSSQLVCWNWFWPSIMTSDEQFVVRAHVFLPTGNCYVAGLTFIEFELSTMKASAGQPLSHFQFLT